jgi:hypothetical protein
MKKHPTQLHTRIQSGFSTIELLIAFSVGIIFLTAAILVSYTDPTLNHQISLDSNQATVLDVSLDNNALAISGNKIGDAVADLIGDWNAVIGDTVADVNDPTQLALDTTIEDTSECIKKITNTTSWTTLGSRNRNISFGTALSDIDTAIALGRGGCDPFPVSDWDNPESDNLAQANVSGADDGTAVDVRSFNNTRYAFITSNPTGGGTGKKEFTVIDVTDKNVQVSDIKATLDKDKGLLNITIFGNYAYVLNNDQIGNQLQIIDISNPTAPSKLLTSYTLPNISCTYHNQNCQRIGRSITYYSGYLYIGTGYMAGNNPEFFIYCINDSSVAGCSPTTPVFRSSLNLDHNINDIAIDGNYAYLATSADYGELTVVDITSKTSPSAPPNYTNQNINNRKYNAVTTASNASTEDGRSIYVLGNYAYLGREKVNNNNEREFYVLDISNLSNITSVGSMSFDMTNNSAYLSGIVVKENIAFLSTYDSNKSFYLVDISNPANPHLRNSCSDFDTSQWATDIDLKDNHVYLVQIQGSTLLKIVYDQGNACTP